MKKKRIKYTLVKHADSREGCFYYSIPELGLTGHVVFPDQGAKLQKVVDVLNANADKLVVS